jgi:hypothetical protein
MLQKFVVQDGQDAKGQKDVPDKHGCTISRMHPISCFYRVAVAVTHLLVREKEVPLPCDWVPHGSRVVWNGCRVG